MDSDSVPSMIEITVTSPSNDAVEVAIHEDAETVNRRNGTGGATAKPLLNKISTGFRKSGPDGKSLSFLFSLFF